MNIILIILLVLAAGLLIWVLWNMFFGQGGSQVQAGGTTTWQFATGNATIIVPRLLLVILALALADYFLYKLMQVYTMEPAWFYALLALTGLLILSWRWVSPWVQGEQVPGLVNWPILGGLVIAGLAGYITHELLTAYTFFSTREVLWISTGVGLLVGMIGVSLYYAVRGKHITIREVLMGLLVTVLVGIALLLLYFVYLNIGSWIMALLSLLLWPIVPSMGSMGVVSIILWVLVGAWVVSNQVDDRDRNLWMKVFGSIIGFKIIWLLGTLLFSTSWSISLPSVNGWVLLLALLVGLLIFFILRNTGGLGKILIPIVFIFGIIFAATMMSGMSFPSWSSSAPGTVAPVTPPSYTPPVYPGNTSGLPQGVISGGNEATY